MTEELIDVLNPDGTPAGARKTKREVHRDGDWHRAAHIWIVTPARRILLQRRSTRKENYPGLWDVSAAGHVSAGETAAEAAIRETGEELGLALGRDELEHVATVRESCVLNGGTYIDREFHEIFIVRKDIDLDALQLDSEEVEDVALVTIEELRDRAARGETALVPHGREYALVLEIASRGQGPHSKCSGRTR